MNAGPDADGLASTDRDPGPGTGRNSNPSTGIVRRAVASGNPPTAPSDSAERANPPPERRTGPLPREAGPDVITAADDASIVPPPADRGNAPTPPVVRARPSGMGGWAVTCPFCARLHVLDQLGPGRCRATGQEFDAVAEGGKRRLRWTG